MEVKKVVTYQQVVVFEEENVAWMNKCIRDGDRVTEIEGWKNNKGLIIVSLGNNKWLVPVLDHTGEERYD